MDIRGGRRSTNIEDRRGMRPVRTGVGLSLGGVLFLVVLSFFGINPLPFLGMATQEQSQVPQSAPGEPAPPYQESAAEAQLRELAVVVLGETEATWDKFFGGQYQPTTLVLYQGATRTDCGDGQAAMGPFYCPTDRKVYIDLSFFDEMATRFGAAGDFAQSYVIAHEVGHHVQNLVGIAEKVHTMQRSVGNKAQANELSVRMELQADCYAGVWAHDAAQRLQVTREDVAEALNAAQAIGDDRLQKQAQGFAVPDSFTHGTSAQRERWFARGFESGDPDACETFIAKEL